MTTAGTLLLLLLLLVVRHRMSLAEAGAAAIAVRLLSGQLELAFAALGRLFESALFLEDLRDFLSLQQVSVPRADAAEASGFEVLSVRDVRFRYPSGSATSSTGSILSCAGVRSSRWSGRTAPARPRW